MHVTARPTARRPPRGPDRSSGVTWATPTSSSTLLRERAQRRRRLDLDLVWGGLRPRVRPPPRARRPRAGSSCASWSTSSRSAGPAAAPMAVYDHVRRPPLATLGRAGRAGPAEDVGAGAAAAWHPASRLRRAAAHAHPGRFEALHARSSVPGGPAPAAPLTVRERSLLLLGDEKRLEVLARGRLFGPGRLELRLLRAREVPRIRAPRPRPRRSRARHGGQGHLCSAVAPACEPGSAVAVRWVVLRRGNAILQTYPVDAGLGEPGRCTWPASATSFRTPAACTHYQGSSGIGGFAGFLIPFGLKEV